MVAYNRQNTRELPVFSKSAESAMSQAESDSFQFLQPFWPDLHDLGRKAERAGTADPDSAAMRLRNFAEAMVAKLEEPLGIAFESKATQFDKLRQIEDAHLLDSRLLAKFHTIRKLGNKAAHNHAFDPQHVENLIDDAWSLAAWFCRYVRPEVEWVIPPRGMPADAAPPNDAAANPATGFFDFMKSPDDRTRRIREDVAAAMDQVDPRVRQLRTRMSLREAFAETLTGDQSACLDALEAFFADPQRRIFLLKGYAGTGKTFLAKGLTEYLAAQGRDFRLGAPTGRAAKIISEKTERPARTLHSLIYNFGDVKEFADAETRDSETFKFFAEIRANQDQANAVYIIDEASLVSDKYSEGEFYRSGSGYLLQDLMTYVGFDNSDNDRKIIFIGDPAQLHPVGMNSSPALDADHLSKQYGCKPAEFELKEILRQKAGSGVLRNVQPLRDSLANSVFSGLNFEFDDDVRHIRAEEVLPVYLDARADCGSDFPIIITHSNAEAATLNSAVRNAIFPGRDVVGAGDRLLITANSSVGERFLANGEFVEVAEAGNAVESRSVTVNNRNKETGQVEPTRVDLRFRNLQIIVPADDGSEMLLQVKVLDTLLHDRQATLEAIEQRALYIDFKIRHPHLRREHDKQTYTQVLRDDPYFNALRAKFGYAVTCHKAQGGEWRHVIVSCRNNGEPRNDDNFRWLYTAMTRSSEKLYLLNPPIVRLKPIGASSADQHGFRQALRGSVKKYLADTGIEIDYVAPNQYQEAFYLRRGAETARINVSYNGRFKIGSITAPQPNPLSDQVRNLLAPLSGQTAQAAPPEGGASQEPVPSKPFLQKLHDQLVLVFGARQIRVSFKEQNYAQRYTFARSNDAVEVNIYYDKKDRLKRFVPLNADRLSASAKLLLDEVSEVLKLEIIP
jgi:hypothetical protein